MILDNVLREEKQAETDATSKVCTYDIVLSLKKIFYFVKLFVLQLHTLTILTFFIIIFAFLCPHFHNNTFLNPIPIFVFFLFSFSYFFTDWFLWFSLKQPTHNICIVNIW